MSYQAVVCRLRNVRPHPKADRVALATVMGVQVVVGLDNHNDELGIFFADDGCLSERMLRENNLNATKRRKLPDGTVEQDPQPLNKDPDKAGYFGKNGRVRAQNFLGEKSYGFWIEVGSVAWTGVDIDELEEGFTFTHLNGEEVCKKYINPATLRRAQKNKDKGPSLTTLIRQRFSQLKEHFDTKQLRYEIGRIPEGSILYFTEKVHGTSGRTGHVFAEVPLTPTQEWWNKYFGWMKKIKAKQEYQVVTGTRRVVLDPNQAVDGGYYSGNTFRIGIHNELKGLGLPEGLTLYYEICGFSETGVPIMPAQPIDKVADRKMRKLLKKKYGEEMLFSYGCSADTEPEADRYDVFIYRATMTSKNGRVFELSWPQVKGLCDTLGLTHVPELREPVFYNDSLALQRGKAEAAEALLDIVEEFLDQDSTIDPKHIIEGVCVRIETPSGDTYILKDKGYIFKVLEGIVKSDETVVDTEEAEDLVANGE